MCTLCRVRKIALLVVSEARHGEQGGLQDCAADSPPGEDHSIDPLDDLPNVVAAPVAVLEQLLLHGAISQDDAPLPRHGLVVAAGEVGDSDPDTPQSVRGVFTARIAQVVRNDFHQLSHRHRAQRLPGVHPGHPDALEEDRLTKTRTRIRQNLADFLENEQVDENRFEQEILFYLEKIDITEEKVRLEQHCKYYLEELDKKIASKGRKLSFISQEMGREINTMGAKAYSSEIQRLVVGMKDELEKIKEQVANSV